MMQSVNRHQNPADLEPDWHQIVVQVQRSQNRTLARRHSAEDVQDAAQDGMVALWRAWKAGTTVAEVRFALAVARRRLIDGLRRRQVRRGAETDVDRLEATRSEPHSGT